MAGVNGEFGGVSEAIAKTFTGKPLGLLWAGKIYGTNTGNIFVELTEDGDRYKGLLRLLDDKFGVVVYNLTVDFDGANLQVLGEPKDAPEGSTVAPLSAKVSLNERGEFSGVWQTELGNGGTLTLYPHDNSKSANQPSADRPQQFFTKRHNFKSVVLTKSDLLQIAESFDSEFPDSDVIVSVTTETNHSMYLKHFKDTQFTSDQAKSVKIHVQKPEGDGLSRVLAVEFGQSENFVIAQSIDEAWAIGRVEKARLQIRPFERTYAISPTVQVLGITQIIFLVMLIYLPSLDSILDRTIYVAIVSLLIIGVSYLHSKLITNAKIYLTELRSRFLATSATKLFSWSMGIASTVLATIITAKFDSILTFISGLFANSGS